MEKEVVWTPTAQTDFWNIVNYLKQNWPEEVLNKFSKALHLKIQLYKNNHMSGLRVYPVQGLEKLYLHLPVMLIYSITKDHIVIHKLTHRSQNN